jgi:hypothetical protein
MGEKPTGMAEEGDEMDTGVVGDEGAPGSRPAEGRKTPGHGTSPTPTPTTNA